MTSKDFFQNEDLLYLVLKDFSDKEVCKVARTCKNFKNVSKRVLDKNYKEFIEDRLDYSKKNKIGTVKISKFNPDKYDFDRIGIDRFMFYEDSFIRKKTNSKVSKLFVVKPLVNPSVISRAEIKNIENVNLLKNVKELIVAAEYECYDEYGDNEDENNENKEIIFPESIEDLCLCELCIYDYYNFEKSVNLKNINFYNVEFSVYVFDFNRFRKLESIQLQSCEVEKLDFSELSNLTNLMLICESLTEIILPKPSSLEHLDMISESLKFIDLTEQKNLESVGLHCSRLEVVDLKSQTETIFNGIKKYINLNSCCTMINYNSNSIDRFF